jgi:UDP:flavonoid glycosyltransferase YjiC (YdhE family)
VTLDEPLRVAVFPIAAIGHLNPTLAVMSAIAAGPHAAVWGFAPPGLAIEITGTGAVHVPVGVRPTPAAVTSSVSELVQKTFLWPLEEMSEIVDRVAEISPDLVLYDVFSLPGFIAGRSLGVHSASFVTFPGFGALGEGFVRLHSGQDVQLLAANERYRVRFGVDVLGEGYLPVLFPSRELSIVTAPASLSRSPDAATAPNLHALLAEFEPTCRFVGPCLSCVRAGRSAASPARQVGTDSAPASRPLRLDRRAARFPFELLDSEDRRVVLFSLGTNLTDFRFHSPVGGAPTGRAFLLTMLRRLLDAFGEDPDVILVVAVGTLLDEGDEPRWPSNVIVRDFIPQLELLGCHADAFVTHHGANSTAESILAGVPMVSIPGVGDQLVSAEMAVAAGAAACLWRLDDPYRTCDADRMRRAIRLALDDPSYRNACRTLAAEMRTAGGADEAARLLIGFSTANPGFA